MCQEAVCSTYDFVVVGGGTAGCLLASRLSEVSEWKVLLIEAGGEELYINDIPLIAPMLYISPSNWGYKAQKNDTFGLGLHDGQLIMPRGKVLGGSSTINGQVYTRGNKQNYDHWEALGNDGWGYYKVLPYFLKSEKMTIPQLMNDTTYHSTKGNLYISYPPYHTKISDAFISAGVEKGYVEQDLNAKSQIGVMRSQAAMRDGQRWSSNRAFLQPVRHRPNLRVLTNSMVTEILIDPKSRTAYGVKYKLFGLIPLAAYAKKEVIISAGAVNSPQLLMLSGIGPEDQLKEHGIPMIQNSKVGFNLQDHVSIVNLYFTLNDSYDINLRNIESDMVNIIDYVTRHNGTFTVPCGFEAQSYIDIGDSDGVPEIEMFFGGILLPSIPFYLSSFGILSERLDNFYTRVHVTSKQGFTIIPILLHPYSSGRIKLKDSNPFSPPLIFPDYFSDPRDMEVLVKGIRLTTSWINTNAFQKLGAKLYHEPIPPCDQHDFDSDKYWECNIRYMTLSIQHSVGTCKMGNDSDPDAVVDSKLHVRGIKNLRVVDASIMPSIPTGHTMAAVYMIAEKAADMIKDEWHKR